MISVNLILSFLSCLLMGCFYGLQRTDNLTKRPAYWGGFPPGQAYELVQDAFCLQDSYHFGLFLADHYYSEKRSRMFRPNEYEEAGVNEDVKIVSSGIRIQCSRLVGRRGGGLTQIDAYGVILDGPLAGAEVGFGDLTKSGEILPRALPYNSTLLPRPEFLRVVPATEDKPRQR